MRQRLFVASVALVTATTFISGCSGGAHSSVVPTAPQASDGAPRQAQVLPSRLDKAFNVVTTVVTTPGGTRTTTTTLASHTTNGATFAGVYPVMKTEQVSSRADVGVVSTIVTYDKWFPYSGHRGRLAELGLTFDNAARHETDTNAAPYQTLEITPFGLTAPSFDATVNTTLAATGTDSTGSYTENDTFNADGSYAIASATASGSVTQTANSDGTGYLNNTAAGHTTSVSFGAPKIGASGMVIPVTTAYDGVLSPTIDVPDWYPGGGAAASPLQTDRIDENLFTAIPSQCMLAATFGTVALDLHESLSALDPVGGTVFSGTVDRYLTPYWGEVCEIHTFDTKIHDNQSSGALTRDEQVARVVTLQTATPHAASALSGARSTQSVASSEAMASADDALAQNLRYELRAASHLRAVKPHHI